MTTTLVLVLCLFAVSFADEIETYEPIWLEPKTWTGPGILPGDISTDVTTLDWGDGMVSRRRLSPTIPWRSNKRRAMRRKLEDLLDMKEITSPSKLKKRMEKGSTMRSMPKQQYPVYVDKDYELTQKQPTRKDGTYTYLEPGPNWLGMLASFRRSNDEETRRKAPNVIVDEESNVDNSQDNSQINKVPEVENTDINENPAVKVLPEEKETEVDMSTWQKPNCVCVRRSAESPIQTTKRVIDGSGTRIVYQRRKSSSIKCSCSADTVAKFLQKPHDANEEIGAQEDETLDQDEK